MLSQVVQHTINSIDINLVVTEAYSPEDEQLLIRQIEAHMGKKILIPSTMWEEKIIKSKAGKFKLVIHKIMQNNQKSNPLAENEVYA